MNDVILRQEDIDRFNAILTRLTLKARLLLSVLVHKDGHLLASVGQLMADTTSIAALISANFSSTIAVANLIGEKEFKTQFHRGKNKNIFVAVVDDNTFIVLIFDDQTTIDIVRVYTEEYTNELGKSLERCYSGSGDLEPLDLEMNEAPLDSSIDSPVTPASGPDRQTSLPAESPTPSRRQPEPQSAPSTPGQTPPVPSGLPPVLPRALPHTVRAAAKNVVEKPRPPAPPPVPSEPKPVTAEPKPVSPEPKPLPSESRPVTTDTELARAAASISARHATEVQYNPARKSDAPTVNADYLRKKAHEVRSAEEIKAKNPLLSKIFSKQK